MKQIFTKDYWISQIKSFTNVKKIVLMGIMLALAIILGAVSSMLQIKVFGRKMSITFIIWPIVGMMFGSLPAMILAMLSDIINYFVFPSGYPFYVGYTLTLMLTGFLSGLFFYKQNVGIIRSFLFKGICNFGIHVGIETFFLKDIMKWDNEAFNASLIAGLTKNAILWPFESLLIIVVLMSLIIPMKQFKIIDESIENGFKIF